MVAKVVVVVKAVERVVIGRAQLGIHQAETEETIRLGRSKNRSEK
ncbi:hypothetical protein ACFLWR_02485 [Chloroflexota bacterium]